MKKLPVDANLTFGSFNQAMDMLERIDSGSEDLDLFMIRVSSQNFSTAFDVKQNYLSSHGVLTMSDWRISIDISLQYNPDEWSLHLIQSGRETDSVYIRGT